MVSSTTLGACLAVLAVLLLAVNAQDPCNLPYNNFPTNPTAWFGRVAALRACFDNVPFSSTRRTTITDNVKAQLELYSFADVARNPIAPYQLEVRFKQTKVGQPYLGKCIPFTHRPPFSTRQAR
jgi:hypothetical protein